MVKILIELSKVLKVPPTKHPLPHDDYDTRIYGSDKTVDTVDSRFVSVLVRIIALIGVLGAVCAIAAESALHSIKVALVNGFQ